MLSIVFFKKGWYFEKILEQFLWLLQKNKITHLNMMAAEAHGKSLNSWVTELLSRE